MLLEMKLVAENSATIMSQIVFLVEASSSSLTDLDILISFVPFYCVGLSSKNTAFLIDKYTIATKVIILYTV